jgi:heme exporter protein CcmD
MDTRGDQDVMSEGFWSMGGYARYVWPCFAFAGAVIAWNVWSARRARLSARVRARRALEMAAGDES